MSSGSSSRRGSGAASNSASRAGSTSDSLHALQHSSSSDFDIGQGLLHSSAVSGAPQMQQAIDGRRYATHFKGSKTGATKELRRLLTDGDAGQHIAPSKLTLAQWVIDWLALKERSLKARTVENYELILTRHVVPVLGALPLQKITGREIDKLYGGLTLGPRATHLLHVVVKACFASAVKKKIISANPVADAEKPSGDGEANETILDDEELGRLVKAFEGHSLYPIVATAAFTGMRRNGAGMTSTSSGPRSALPGTLKTRQSMAGGSARPSQSVA
jgi:hypothetical protein